MWKPLALVVTLALPLRQQSGSIDPERAASIFGEAEEAALADDGKLWGHSLVGPILFADPRTRQVVANQPDPQGLLSERDLVYTGTLPPEVTIANTGIDWAGERWTMVMWPLPEERFARTQLVLHESFHRIQPKLRHGGSSAPAAHLDTEAGRTWLRLELRALARAVDGPEDHRPGALEDALIFRARRRELFPEALVSEAALERHEGLAEYTGLVLCGLAAAEQAERAAARLRGEDSSASFARSFAYVTGPAYGLLLDRHAGDWRGGVDKRSDLTALLARAVGWRAPESVAQAAGERALLHGAAEVSADERRRAEERAALQARERARFVDGPVLVLSFGGSVNYSFDPTDVTTLPGAGTLYGSARVVDAWGVLDAGGSRALFVLAPDGAYRAAQVPSPRDASARPVAGEGWTLSLAQGWTLAPGERAGDWKVVRSN